MARVALAATIHDDEARLVPAIERHAAQLRAIFDGIALNITDTTPATVSDAARRALGARVLVHAVDESRIGRARRDAVRLALEFDAPAILYSDFDHLLRWLESDEAELRAILAAQADVDVLVVGRSSHAFAAEPARLRLTEAIVNRIYWTMTGRSWDLMFAVRRLSRRAAQTIVASSRIDTLANDVEWPLLAEANALSLGYAPADGLSYRTMEEFGAPADRRDGDPGEWIRRIEFAAQRAAVLRAYLANY